MAADKSLRFYLLAVCFVAMVCTAITTGMVLYGLVKITAPELTLDNWSYAAHQSLESFRNSQYNPDNSRAAALYAPGGTARAIALNPGPPGDAGQATTQPMSDAALEQVRQKSYQQVLSNHRRGALQDILRLGIVLFVSVALFASHWRLARRQSLSGDQ